MKRRKKTKIIRREKNKIYINGLPEKIMKQKRKFEELIDDDGIKRIYIKSDGTFEVRYSSRKIAKRKKRELEAIIY